MPRVVFQFWSNVFDQCLCGGPAMPSHHCGAVLAGEQTAPLFTILNGGGGRDSVRPMLPRYIGAAAWPLLKLSHLIQICGQGYPFPLHLIRWQVARKTPESSLLDLAGAAVVACLPRPFQTGKVVM